MTMVMTCTIISKKIEGMLTKVYSVLLPASQSEMDLDILGDEVKFKSTRKIYQVEYKSLSQPEVEQLIAQDVEHISGIFGVEVSIALTDPCITSVLVLTERPVTVIAGGSVSIT